MSKLPFLLLVAISATAQTPSKVLCQSPGICEHKCTGEHQHKTKDPVPCCYATFNVEVKHERRKIDCVFRGGKLDIPGKPMEFCCGRYLHSHYLYAPLEGPGESSAVTSPLTAPTGIWIAVSGVYLQNRHLGKAEVTHNFFPFSHTFVFTVLEDGSIGATYSWGNEANVRGWHKNAAEDLVAANEALRGKTSVDIVGPSSLIPFIETAFTQKSKPGMEHANLVVTSNCKTEANELLKLANELKNKK